MLMLAAPDPGESEPVPGGTQAAESCATKICGSQRKQIATMLLWQELVYSDTQFQLKKNK